MNKQTLVYRIRLDRQQPKLDASNLHDLIDLYLCEKQSKIKDATHASYGFGLRRFTRWLDQYAPRCDWKIGRGDLTQYGKHLESLQTRAGSPLTYNTRKMSLLQLSLVFRWAFTNDYLDRDFSPWVPEPSGAPRQRLPIPVERLDKLFRIAAETFNPERNCAILAVLIGTGMRRSECVALNIEDVSFDGPESYPEGGGLIRILCGKGDKPRTVVFDAPVGRFLRAHLQRDGRRAGPLWTAWGKRRLSGHALADNVRAIARGAGLEEYIGGPHDFRRAFATYWSKGRRGLDVAKALSVQLGHSSSAMTLQYILQDVNDVRELHVSPMERVAGT